MLKEFIMLVGTLTTVGSSVWLFCFLWKCFWQFISDISDTHEAKRQLIWAQHDLKVAKENYDALEAKFQEFKKGITSDGQG